ncbi:MAG: type II toxin-antitoxin system VapB family antitoxin [Thermodesulfobacteriota bacterium]
MARTVLNIDDALYDRAKRLTGLKKKVDVVTCALKHLIEQKELEGILELRGKVTWEEDLEGMRRGRDGSC